MCPVYNSLVSCKVWHSLGDGKYGFLDVFFFWLMDVSTDYQVCANDNCMPAFQNRFRFTFDLACGIRDGW